MKKLVSILLFLLLLASSAAAQEPTLEPTAQVTAEPSADSTVDIVTTTTTTTMTPATDIGLTLQWALAFVMLWQSVGIAYAITVEKTIKPTVLAIVSQLTSNMSLQKGVLVIAVFVGAFLAVSSGGINLFADAPFVLFENATPMFLLVVNSIFVAVGAFMGHEIWDTLQSWLKKIKAISDIIKEPTQITSRPASQTTIPGIG